MEAPANAIAAVKFHADRRDLTCRRRVSSSLRILRHRRTGPSARFRAEAGTLYVVATPLGNLRDITLRGVDILGSADVVAAEDTRVTSVLLRHLGIATRPLSLHEHNEERRVARILDALGAGRSVALVSDAGTPAVSDPGARLVRAVLDAGFPVVPIPGANAAIAAVSAAGLDADRFLFLGFLPANAKARRELLATAAALPCALLIYEAPHRVAATAAALADVLGGERELVVARELTKKFETITRMPLAEAVAWFARRRESRAGRIRAARRPAAAARRPRRRGGARAGRGALAARARR